MSTAPDFSPNDSKLPQLALALDGEHIATQLAAWLARGDSGLKLLGCRLERFRYRPGQRLTTLYEVRLQEGAGSRRWRHWVSGLMTADDRVVRQHRRLCRQAPPPEAGASPDLRPILVETPRLLLLHFPSDLKLPQLGELLTGRPPPLESFYRGEFGDAAEELAIAPPQPVRYRPQLGAVLRQRGQAGGPWQVYLKLRAGDQGRTSFERQRRLCAAGGPRGLVPARPLAFIAALQLQVTEAATGLTLEQRLIAGSQQAADWQRLGEALADFHCSDVPIDRVGDPASRVLRARAAATLIEWACPPMRPLLQRLGRRLSGFSDTAVRRPCHGDLKPDHLFYDGEVLRVIDLEDVALADPLFDVALLLARVELLRVEGKIAAGMLEASACFVDAYRARVPAAWGRRLAPLYACAALDMARYAIQHQLPGWRRCSRYFCERALAALERPRWSFFDDLAPPVSGVAAPAPPSDDDFFFSRGR